MFLKLLMAGFLISTPATYIVPKLVSYTNWNICKNGDTSAPGYGSVTDELTDMGINVNEYQIGIKTENQFLKCSESDSSIYLYVYLNQSNSFNTFNMCSAGIYNGEISEWANQGYKNISWTNVKIEPVSFDETGKLVKYKLIDIAVNKDVDHVYVFREIYDSNNRENMSYVLKVGLLYMYNSDLDLTRILSEETLTITNKIVAYQLYPYTDLVDSNNVYSALYERLYTGFSISDLPSNYGLNDLFDATITYDPVYYGGYTDIPLNYVKEETFGGFSWNCAKEYDKAIGSVSLKDHWSKDVFYKEFTEKNIVKTVEHSEVKITYEEKNNTALWGIDYNNVAFRNGTNTLTYDTIQNKNDMDQNLINSDEELKKCDYFISFENRPINCFSQFQVERWDTGLAGEPYGRTSSVGNIFIGPKEGQYNGFTEWWIGTRVPEINNEYCSKNMSFDTTSDHTGMLVEANNVSVLHLTFKNDTGVLSAIAVDKYDDTIGQKPIQDDSTTIKNSFLEFFNKYWNIIKWVLIGICSLICISLLLRLLNLFKF